jgi:hypothetical protein
VAVGQAGLDACHVLAVGGEGQLGLAIQIGNVESD